jgi:signal transduction histidine kinase
MNTLQLGDDPPDEKLTQGVSERAELRERQNLEEQLLRVGRLESIGLVAAGIARDLDNVLAPMPMAVRSLRDRSADPKDALLAEKLEKSLEMGADLLREILSFARGPSGEHRSVNVRQLIRNIALVLVEAFPKNIHLEIASPEGLWDIAGNPMQLHQVFLNLAVNARDAMSEGGALRIRTENCVLDEPAAAGIPGARPGAFVRIEVEDSGEGIAPELQAEVREPIGGAEGPARRIGLGLLTVRSIVNAHCGFTAVRGAPGAGSLFSIYLPVAGTPAPAADLSAPSTPQRGNGDVILIVDDEERVRDLTAMILAQAGHRGAGGSSGSEVLGLRIQHAKDVRLAISDARAPGADGPSPSRSGPRPDTEIQILPGWVLRLRFSPIDSPQLSA